MINIRPSQASDVPALFEVWHRSVTATHAFLAPQDLEALQELVRDQYLPVAQLLVAEADGAVIGFLGRDGDELESLFVDPTWQGKGVGTALIEKGEELGAPFRHVEVNEANDAARGFYEAKGFTLSERLPKDRQGRDYPILILKR